MVFRPPFHFNLYSSTHPYERLARAVKMGHWGHWGRWGGHWGPHRRGPSRLLWFVFGAGMATWWIKGRECREYQVKHCMRNRIPPGAYPPPASAQPQAQGAPDAPASAPAADPGAPPQRWPEEWHWHGRRWEWGWPPQMKDSQPGAPTPGLPPKPADGWEDETQRLQRMTQQATETLAEISEAGLDSLLSTVESLKGKIVERRAQREREQAQQQAREAELQAQREERFRQFEEWRQQQEEAEKKSRRLV